MEHIRLYTFLLLAASLLFAQSCVNDLEEIKQVTVEPEDLFEVGEGVEIVYSDSGTLKAKIIADVLLRSNNPEDPYTEFNEGLRVYFFNASGEIDSKLKAGYGKIYNNDQELLVQDDVRVVNTLGDKLSSEELVWKKNERKIYSDKFVKIQTAEEIIYGNGLVANEDFTEYTIKDVTGVVSVEGTGFEDEEE